VIGRKSGDESISFSSCHDLSRDKRLVDRFKDYYLPKTLAISLSHFVFPLTFQLNVVYSKSKSSYSIPNFVLNNFVRHQRSPRLSPSLSFSAILVTWSSMGASRVFTVLFLLLCCAVLCFKTGWRWNLIFLFRHWHGQGAVTKGEVSIEAKVGCWLEQSKFEGSVIRHHTSSLQCLKQNILLNAGFTVEWIKTYHDVKEGTKVHK